MTIKDRIEKIKPYFVEMQVKLVDNIQAVYVIVNFPRNWIIDEEIEKKFGVTVSPGSYSGEYYFCTDIDSGENVLFDAIEYNIEKMKEAIERAQLFSAKTKELKELFENENISIEQLRSLKFDYENSFEQKIEKEYIKLSGKDKEKDKEKNTNKNE